MDVLEVRCAHPRTANRRFLLFSPLFIFSSVFSGIADIRWILVFYTEAKRANDTKKRREREREASSPSLVYVQEDTRGTLNV